MSERRLCEVDRRERAGSRFSMPASLRSEPDLDTIMPLPGYMLGRAGGDGRGGEGYQHQDSEESEDGRENTLSPSFTTVEVGIHHSIQRSHAHTAHTHTRLHEPVKCS